MSQPKIKHYTCQQNNGQKYCVDDEGKAFLGTFFQELPPLPALINQVTCGDKAEGTDAYRTCILENHILFLEKDNGVVLKNIFIKTVTSYTMRLFQDLAQITKEFKQAEPPKKRDWAYAGPG